MAIRDIAINPVTSAEIATFVQWCTDHGIKNDDGTNDAQFNNEVVAGYMLEKWGVPEWTRQNLDAALVQLRPHLRFYTPAQQAWNRESASLSQADRDQILNYVRGSKNLKSDADNLFVNATALVQWIVSHGYPVGNFDVILSQVAAQSRYPLVKQIHLQGSEAEAQAAREAAKQQPAKKSDDEVKIPAGLSPALHEHYRQTHKPVKAATPTTPAESMTYYEKASRELVANVTSNNDREQAAKFLRNANANWELTYRRIHTWIQRRAQERASAGR
jgi:hypothetical protein